MTILKRFSRVRHRNKLTTSYTLRVTIKHERYNAKTSWKCAVFWLLVFTGAICSPSLVTRLMSAGSLKEQLCCAKYRLDPCFRGHRNCPTLTRAYGAREGAKAPEPAKKAQVSDGSIKMRDSKGLTDLSGGVCANTRSL